VSKVGIHRANITRLRGTRPSHAAKTITVAVVVGIHTPRTDRGKSTNRSVMCSRSRNVRHARLLGLDDIPALTTPRQNPSGFSLSPSCAPSGSDSASRCGREGAATTS
jgi:hypothetical protein